MGWDRPLHRGLPQAPPSSPDRLCEQMFKHTPNALPHSACADHMQAAGLTHPWRRCTKRLPAVFVGQFGSETQVVVVARLLSWGCPGHMDFARALLTSRCLQRLVNIHWICLGFLTFNTRTRILTSVCICPPLRVSVGASRGAQSVCHSSSRDTRRRH